MVHVYILLFEDKTIWYGTRVIKILSDTLNDLKKLNHGEYSKYLLLYSLKIDMVHFYYLFLKDKSIKNGSRKRMKYNYGIYIL